MGGASFRSYGHEAFWFDQAESHYRMDMRTRQVTAFDALTNTEKLRIALFEASFRVPGEAGTKLLGLLSTTNLAITASVLAIWVGSHATPLGWVVDITMVGVGLIAIGAEAADVAQELCLFANGIIDASDEIQCRMAASHLARAIAIIGVDVVLAILLKKAVFTMKSRFKAPEAAPVPALPAQQRTTPSQASGRGEVPPAVGPKVVRPPIYENPSNIVKSRVDELRSQIPDNSRGRITMAVAVVEDVSGTRSVLVSTSEPRAYLRAGVTLQPGEMVIAGTGHAEVDIVSYANANNLKIIDIGATRPVCVPCQDVIGPTKANISTPLKKLPGTTE